jgi:hypothetical protein
MGLGGKILPVMLVIMGGLFLSLGLNGDIVRTVHQTEKMQCSRAA